MCMIMYVCVCRCMYTYSYFLMNLSIYTSLYRKNLEAILLATSIPSAQIVVSKYYSLLKETRAPWRNS